MISTDQMIDLIERFAEYDCFQPWDMDCSKLTGGEEPCESCEAKRILNQISKEAARL